MRRFPLFLLFLAGFFLSTVGTVPTSAGGYPYTGQVVGYFPECNKSRVLGIVLDEQGNHVTEPVVIRLWAEGENIP